MADFHHRAICIGMRGSNIEAAPVKRVIIDILRPPTSGGRHQDSHAARRPRRCWCRRRAQEANVIAAAEAAGDSEMNMASARLARAWPVAANFRTSRCRATCVRRRRLSHGA